MQVFRYEIVDKSGKRMYGAMQADTEAQVRQALIRKGFTVTAVVSPQTAGLAQAERVPSHRPVPAAVAPVQAHRTSGLTAPKKELALFFRQLAQQAHAGISMYQALNQIGMYTPHHGMRTIIQTLTQRVQSGGTLNDGMREFPRAFPQHLVGTVAAGEVGGLLPLILGDIALEYEMELQASSRILRGINIWIWIFSLTNIISAVITRPMMRGALAAGLNGGVSSGLPFAAAMLKPCVEVLAWCIPLLTVLVLAYHVPAWWLRQPSQKKLHDTLVMKVPGYSKASRERAAASFTRILARLQQAGVPAIKAWEVASHVPENSIIAGRLQEETPFIARGGRYSEALARSQAASADDLRLLANGENTGQVIDSLQTISTYYADAAVHSAKKATWIVLDLSITVGLITLGATFIAAAGYFDEVFKAFEKFAN